jgi:sigma-B regulation protein RsbU (phosphoserine phosphatase)
MLVLRISAMHTMRQFRDTLVSQTSTNLVAISENRLKFIADAFSLVLWKERDNLETALVAQILQAERLLAEKPPPASSPIVYEHIKGNASPITDALPSALHFRTDRKGGFRFLAVSYSSPVFHLAPGTNPEAVSADVNRLAGMTSFFKELFSRLRETAIWGTISLQNGLFCIYPGTESIPGGFDPRQQEWYQAAIGRPEIYWSAPYLDPATRQVVLSVSRSFESSEGGAGGVVSIVVPVSRLLENSLLEKNIPTATRTFLCYLEPRSTNPETALLVLARDENDDEPAGKAHEIHRSWRVQLEPYYIVSDDADQFNALLEDVVIEQGNIRRMPFEKRDCLWVYGQAQFSSFFLLILPYQEIIKPVDRSALFLQQQIDRMVRMTGYWLAGIVVVVILLAFAFSRTVTQPIWALVEGARQLAAGQFDTRVEIRSRDEFGIMGQVFNQVGPQLKDRHKMRRSLEVAMEVQRSLLPKTVPLIPGFDIAANCIYCDETGGDYYDFIDETRTGKGVLRVVVGDVSGHGISSALLMTTARGYLRQRAAMSGGMDRIISDVNDQLTRDVAESGQFVTLFFCEIDVVNRTIRWVRAGHEPAFIYDESGGDFKELSGKGLPLGIFRETEFEIRQRGLQPGQIVIFTTDGIRETVDQKGRMFGVSRLKELIHENARQSAQEIAQAVIDAAVAFRRPLKQDDDITLVVIKVKEPSGEQIDATVNRQ